MTSVRTSTLADDLPYGVRISGIGRASVRDPGIRAEVNAIFEDRGLIVFEDVEPSNGMQAAITEIFGLDHAHARDVTIPEEGEVEGFIELEANGISEVNGVHLSYYLPWHFDQWYSSKLIRAGVLRPISLPPEGGLTGFADGIQLYQTVSPELRANFENLNILYDSAFLFWDMKFGRPKSYSRVEGRDSLPSQLTVPARMLSVHPAIWQRPTGERVLHISPQQAAGIEGMETPEGDALLEAMCREIYANMTPYFHKWKPTEMVIWDNLRFIHSVTGHSPQHVREMRRTTIFGDYDQPALRHA
jgi:taurine dioxygenase